MAKISLLEQARKSSEPGPGTEVELCSCSVIHEASVEAARSSLPPRSRLSALAELMKVFGDEGRLRMLFALAESELCVCDLATLLGHSQSAVSHQLALLRAAHLVRSRREGKVIFYALDDPHVQSLLELGLEHAAERIRAVQELRS